MSAERDIRLVFSVDVEEEGLFTGRYDSEAKGVLNVSSLSRLEFLTREFDFPLTLLCTWPVLTNADCAVQLRRWQDELNAEIGLHLHPWNTPPIRPLSTAWTPSECISPDELAAKLKNLVAACQEVTGRDPRSFRMGRFDLGPRIRDLLPAHGIQVDSSVVPMSWTSALNGAFLASSDPYPLLCDSQGRTRLLEVPLTMTALSPRLSSWMWKLAKDLSPHAKQQFFKRFQTLAVVGTPPVWYPLPSMKLGARLHLYRGGTLIHLFLHSSELCPGACPHLPDEIAVNRLVKRVRDFLLWLKSHILSVGSLRGVTLCDLADDPGGTSSPRGLI
jgi:hypothetical protein